MKRDLKLIIRAMAMMMAILVMAPSTGLAQTLYFCTMSGEVGPKCCCNHDRDSLSAKGPALLATPCCEVSSKVSRHQAQGIQVEITKLKNPTFIALPEIVHASLIGVTLSQLALLNGSTSPPNTGPSLCIQHCSYLI